MKCVGHSTQNVLKILFVHTFNIERAQANLHLHCFPVSLFSIGNLVSARLVIRVSDYCSHHLDAFVQAVPGKRSLLGQALCVLAQWQALDPDL